MIPVLDQPSYGITRALPGLPLDEAIARVRAALAAEGFGVVSEIDMRATLQKKLGVEVRPYLILGACNPQAAYRALQLEPGVGLLLPCNVVVSDDGAGGSVVSAVDASAMFALVGRPELQPIADDIRARLARAVAAT